MIQVAVIGLGNMGRHHVRHYAANAHAQLTAVFDVNKERAEQFATEYHCNAYTDLDTLLSSETLDAVTIAAPTSLHFEIAKKVLNKGIHVLIEKPIADTVEKAQALIDLAKQKGVCLMVGHIERLNPAVQKLKTMISAGQLGEIVSLISRRVGTFPPQIQDANVVIDLAVHDIDIFAFLLDKQPDHVYGHRVRALIKSREDHANLFLTYPKTSGLIQVNWVSPVRIRSLSVNGTKGYADLNFLTGSLDFYPSRYTYESDSTGKEAVKFENTEKESMAVEKYDQLAKEIDLFLTAVRTKTPPPVTGEMGRDALAVALKALQ